MDSLLLAVGLVMISFITLKLLSKKKHIPPAVLSQSLKDLKAAAQLQPGHAILELHKIFVHSLKKTSSSTQNAAKVIEPFAKRFPNEKDVWYFHRMRNRAAHEPNFKATPRDRQKAYEVYKRALESLGK